MNQWRKSEHIEAFKLYDRFSREVVPGDAVMLFNKWDTAWRIANIELVLPTHPQDPPAHLKVTLAAVFINAVPGGTPMGDMVKVMDASELQADPGDQQRRAAEAAQNNGAETSQNPTEPRP